MTFTSRPKLYVHVIGANFRAWKFMIVVRIALRDVELLLHFDIFTGDTRRLLPIIITMILRLWKFSKFQQIASRGGQQFAVGTKLEISSNTIDDYTNYVDIVDKMFQ